MKENSVFAALAGAMEKNKTLKFALYAAIALTALMLFLTSGLFGSRGEKGATDEKQQAAKQSGNSDTAQLEKRLEEILTSMAGVGRAKVMLTLDKTEEQVLAMNDRTTNGGASTSRELRPATLSGGGGESPIVLTELLPKIRGVIVSAEGAANIAVKLNIIAAVSTVLGIDENCVEVFVMAG